MAIQTFVLENGMQVILEENRVSKVVSFNALVKVGSANETDSEAGICHVIEHMLFKGTPTRPAGAIARDIEAAGGEINAYTSIDQTVFYVNMATQFAYHGLEILADAIIHPLFDAEELEREKEVILEEVRREQDNPSRMVSESLFGTAFDKHNYRRPIIGYPKTVRSFTHEQILKFYRKWYTPQNVVFIAVGDFDTATMLREIRKVFANYEGPAAPAYNISSEPRQAAPKVLIKKMNIQSVYMTLGFHIPEFTHPDVPALDTLAHILGGADSSRLEQEVKEKARLVHNIYSYSFTPRSPGLFAIGSTLDDEDVEAALCLIRSEVEKIYNEPVTSEELSRAKLNIRSNQIYEKETVGGQGSKIAYFLATAGSHEFEGRYYQMLADVNTKTVSDVAKKYLSFENCTVVLLVPDSAKAANAKTAIEKIIAPGPQSKVESKPDGRPKPCRLKLKNGATMLVLENHSLPLISICATVLGGTRFENKKNNGVSTLMSRVITKGTKTRSAVDIATNIEQLAGHIEGIAGRNTAGLRCEFLSEYLHDGFSLFADVLCNPSFAEEEVQKEKKLLIQAIKDQEDALPSLTFAEFAKTLFPKHPYGLRVSGTKESVRSLRRASLVRFHRSLMHSGSLVLAVVGDVNPKEIEKIANDRLCRLPKGRAISPKIHIDPRQKSIRESIITKREKQQAHIVLGFQGITFKSDDRYAMAVMNNILSGQGGRLFLTLRDKMSLAYAVNSVNQEGIDPGFFAVYIGTEPGKIKTATNGILSELTKISSELVSKEELERSKQYLVGTYELELQRNMALAGIYSFNEANKIPLEEVDEYPSLILKVTREDVLAAAKRYITPKAYSLAIVKPG